MRMKFGFLVEMLNSSSSALIIGIVTLHWRTEFTFQRMPLLSSLVFPFKSTHEFRENFFFFYFELIPHVAVATLVSVLKSQYTAVPGPFCVCQ